MKRGIFTSEFWFSIGAAVVAAVTPQLPSSTRVVVIGAISALYTLARTYFKSKNAGLDKALEASKRLQDVVAKSSNLNDVLNLEVPAVSPENRGKK